MKSYLISQMIFASCLIHIYRFNKNKPKTLVGVVEEIETKEKKAFTNYDELWEILNSLDPLKASLKRKCKVTKKIQKKEERPVKSPQMAYH